MKTPQLPHVDWAKMYGQLAEAVDHAGLRPTIDVKTGVITLVPIVEPTYFSLDMDGTMVPDPDGQWMRR